MRALAERRRQGTIEMTGARIRRRGRRDLNLFGRHATFFDGFGSVEKSEPAVADDEPIACSPTLTFHFLQMREAKLLPTPNATLPAPPAMQLPRVAACKLTLPHAQAVTVKTDHYAIVGSTLLLRACPLPSQPLLQLPSSSGVKLPRLEALAACRR